jgi:hypothetical protein
MSSFRPANAAADELREAALAVAAEPAESLAVDFAECLNRTAAIGAAVAAVSNDLQTAKLRRGYSHAARNRSSAG